MGYFGCEYCGEANQLLNDNHVCNIEKLKQRILDLESESHENRVKKDVAQDAILHFIAKLIRRMDLEDMGNFLSNQHYVLDIPKVFIESLVLEAKCINYDNDVRLQRKDINFLNVAHQFASEQCAYSSLACAAFDLFKRKTDVWGRQNELDIKVLLKDLYDACFRIQKVFGYKDCIVDEFEHPECVINPMLSRVCENGTKSCGVTHE